MTGQITTTQYIPPDVWTEVFSHLDIRDMQSVHQVSQLFRRLAENDVLWAPGLPRELRFCVQGHIDGTDGIEQIFMDFIEHRFVDNHVSVLEVRFAKASGAMISLSLGAGVHPTYGPEGVEPVGEEWDTICEKRLHINCPAQQLTVERYVVLSHEARDGNVVFPNPNQMTVYRSTSEFFGRYHEAYGDSPERWFYLSGYQLENWYYVGFVADSTQNRIYCTAAARLGKPPVGPEAKAEENIIDTAISTIKEAVASVSNLFAGLAAGVIALQHFLD